MAVVKSANGAACLALSAPFAELAELLRCELLLDGLNQRLSFGKGQADVPWDRLRGITVQSHELHSLHRRCIATVEFKDNRAPHGTS